jgi:hypothetical protein
LLGGIENRIKLETTMKHYIFKIFPKSDKVSVLRFLASDGGLIGERELAIPDVQRFIDEVEASYRAAAPGLSDLGRRLYEWLDGSTERWLEKVRAGAPGLVIHLAGC